MDILGHWAWHNRRWLQTWTAVDRWTSDRLYAIAASQIIQLHCSCRSGARDCKDT